MIAYKGRVGVLGATSFIEECLLPLLVEDGYDVVAFSRRKSLVRQEPANRGIIWRLLPITHSHDIEPITKWICLAPISVLPNYFSFLSLSGAKHIVVVSSTSRFTKELSFDPAEQCLAAKIIESEESLINWAEKNQVIWTILRPTLVYGLGRDKNVNVIARFIQRFDFFPLLGEARGLRQPVHAQDVALCCKAALNAEKAFNRAYNISGGEILTYREMGGRVFSAIGKKPRFVIFPFWIFRIAVFCLRVLPSFRRWSPARAERMNSVLVFDHQDASRDLDFFPRPFQLSSIDLPNYCRRAK